MVAPQTDNSTEAAAKKAAAAAAAKNWDFVPFGTSWLFIGFVLLVGASFPSTEKLAAMFAYLILATAVLVEGPAAIANFQKNTPFGGVNTAKEVSGSIDVNGTNVPLGR